MSPIGFKEIRLNFELDTDASEEQLENLIRLTERYCVVYQTLNHPPNIAVCIASYLVKISILCPYTWTFTIWTMEPLRKTSQKHTPGTWRRKKNTAWSTPNTGSMRLEKKFFALPTRRMPRRPTSASGSARLMAEKIIEVQPELAEGFLGGVETNAAGAAIFQAAQPME